MKHELTRSAQSLIWLAGLILYLASSASALDERNGSLLHTSALLDLLQAEVLDTISLDQAVHFTTPQTKDVVAPAGTYQVVASERDQLRLISEKGNKTILVSALSTTHQEGIATPIALYVRDDDKFPHILLLLPDGNGLEAVGSYDVTRSRSIRSFQLTPNQIQAALKTKLEKKVRREP